MEVNILFFCPKENKINVPILIILMKNNLFNLSQDALKFDIDILSYEVSYYYPCCVNGEAIMT